MILPVEVNLLDGHYVKKAGALQEVNMRQPSRNKRVHPQRFLHP